MKKASLKLVVLILSYFLVSCNSNEEKNEEAEAIPSIWNFNLRVYGFQRNPLQQIVIDSDWDSAYYLISSKNFDRTHPYPYKLQDRVAFHLSSTERDSIYNISRRINDKCRSRNYEMVKIEKYMTGNVELDLHSPFEESHIECNYYGIAKSLKSNQNMELLLKFFNDRLKGRAILE